MRRTRGVAALRQHRVERHAVEEVLVPVAAREGEPRRVDGERREPEPGVGDTKRLDASTRASCSRIGRSNASIVFVGDASRSTSPRAMPLVVRIPSEPADQVNDHLGPAPFERLEDGEPGSRRRVEVPRAAPRGHDRDRPTPVELLTGRARGRARAARAVAAGAGRTAAAGRRRPPTAGPGSAAPPPRSSAGAPRTPTAARAPSRRGGGRRGPSRVGPAGARGAGLPTGVPKLVYGTPKTSVTNGAHSATSVGEARLRTSAISSSGSQAW